MTARGTPPAPAEASLRRLKWTVALLVLVVAGLGTILVLDRVRSGRWLPASDTELRAARSRLLSQLSPGILDSFPDAQVGRTLLPDLEPRIFQGVTVQTNAQGMREEAYVLPKPAGLIRVVILGDSFVFGWAVEVEARVGAHLSRMLREGAGEDAPELEVLHLAVPSWNLVSEATYVRRQLDLLQPDLVVQVAVPNDLDDEVGVRGFGTLAGFAPAHPERADAVLSESLVAARLGGRGRSPLTLGLDHESRSRYAEAGAEIAHLARKIDEQGGRYRLLVHFGRRNAVARRHLEEHLSADTLLWLPEDFSDQLSRRVSEADNHWSASAHADVAAVLYEAIRSQALLPLELDRRNEAEVAFALLHERGRLAAQDERPAARLLGAEAPASGLVLPLVDAVGAAQIHGGIDAEGRVGPYASLMLATDGGRRLRVEGRGLARPSLGKVELGLWADEVLLARHPVSPDTSFVLVLPLPPDLALRPFLSVRFTADTFVYAGRDLRHAVVFQLERVSLEP